MSQVDLRQLAVERAPVATPRPRRSAFVLRYLLPALLLVAFSGLLVYAAWDTVQPPRPVTVVPVLTVQGDSTLLADTPLFQAAGWVEPRPTATLITARSEGVVDRLLVVEGQTVEAGTPVAELESADADLSVIVAEADLDLRKAEKQRAQAALTAAEARLKTPLHLQADLADAEVLLVRSETERSLLPLQIQAAETRQRLARQDLDGKKKGQGTIPEQTILKAQADFDIASAALEELKTREKRLPQEVAALQLKRDALKQQLEKRTEEIRKVSEADAELKAATAHVKQAEAALKGATLRKDRMIVRAQTPGRVLALLARPGTRLGGTHDAGVVSVYDPTSLQVRTDVRLDDIGKVQSGQKVKLSTAAIPGRVLDGEVLFATSQADIQKNTLAVKVAVNNPPLNLKPDMLVQVTFLSPPRPPGSKESATATVRMLIPRVLVDNGRVWVADQAGGRAWLRSVQVGPVRGELIEITSGLSGSDKLIVGGREGLSDGQRIRVTGEDATLGIGGQ